MISRVETIAIPSLGTMQERGPKQPSHIVIKESWPGNLLSDPGRPVGLISGLTYDVLSTEGFAENPDGQRNLADFYINSVGLTARGPLLDVGFGLNIHIANRFAQRGISAFAVDSRTVKDAADTSPAFTLQPPRIVNINDAGVTIASGDIAELSSAASDFKDKRFGTILFNGSWASEGTNFTVSGYSPKTKHIAIRAEAPIDHYLDLEKRIILTQCREKLTENGVIGAVSSRYAFYGGGYDFSQFVQEKLDFIDFYTKLRDLGAKKFFIIGLSQNGFDQLMSISTNDLLLKRSVVIEAMSEMSDSSIRPYTKDEQVSIREQLRSVNNLFASDDSIKQGNEMNIFDQVARVDAIFAEF